MFIERACLVIIHKDVVIGDDDDNDDDIDNDGDDGNKHGNEDGRLANLNHI